MPDVSPEEMLILGGAESLKVKKLPSFGDSGCMVQNLQITHTQTQVHPVAEPCLDLEFPLLTLHPSQRELRMNRLPE
jgi:hypothetical protein